MLPCLQCLAASVNFIQFAPNFPQCKPRTTCQFYSAKATLVGTRKCPLGMQFSVPNVQFLMQGKTSKCLAGKIRVGVPIYLSE